MRVAAGSFCDGLAGMYLITGEAVSKRQITELLIKRDATACRGRLALFLSGEVGVADAVVPAQGIDIDQ